jgi:hypothetical protein
MRDRVPAERDLPRPILRKVVRRVLENLRRSIYCLQASNGIARGNPTYTAPQIFPLAKDALFAQSILLAAKAFDHHPRAASFLMLRQLRPDIVEAVAGEGGFELARLEAFAAKLRRIRNRALAHDDIDDIVRNRDVWTEQELTAGELSACAGFAFGAANEILRVEFSETVVLLDYTGRDGEELARLATSMALPAKWADQIMG